MEATAAFAAPCAGLVGAFVATAETESASSSLLPSAAPNPKIVSEPPPIFLHKAPVTAVLVLTPTVIRNLTKTLCEELVGVIDILKILSVLDGLLVLAEKDAVSSFVLLTI